MEKPDLSKSCRTRMVTWRRSLLDARRNPGQNAGLIEWAIRTGRAGGALPPAQPTLLSSRNGYK
jgi:hypothetical protein